MTHLMSNGEHAVKGILLVEQHIGMGIASGRVCSAALALVFIYVDPAILKAFTKQRNVFFTKGSKTFKDYFLRLLIWDFLISVSDNGHIQVIDMKIFNACKLFTQANIFMKITKVGINRINKVMIDRNGYFRAGKRCFEGAAIPACASIEN